MCGIEVYTRLVRTGIARVILPTHSHSAFGTKPTNFNGSLQGFSSPLLLPGFQGPPNSHVQPIIMNTMGLLLLLGDTLPNITPKPDARNAGRRRSVTRRTETFGRPGICCCSRNAFDLVLHYTHDFQHLHLTTNMVQSTPLLLRKFQQPQRHIPHPVMG